MNKAIVIGHKNPDTDSVVASIVAEDYFKSVLGIDAKAYRAGELNNETKFVLQEFGIEIPDLISVPEKEDCIVLIDHNEVGQIVDEIDYRQVAYIIDHHKLSVITEKPIFCRTEPLGSTSSIIAKMFIENGFDMAEDNAKLLLAGILSDTWNFTGPTSTKEDKKVAEKLNAKAKINFTDFAEKMFIAKSNLEGISADNIIGMDYKNFDMGAKKVGVGVWETMKPEKVNEKKEELLKALLEKKQAEKNDYIFFFVIDIMKQNSFLYIIGESERKLAENVFKIKSSDDIVFLKDIVSRKKQIVPSLTEELTK